MTKSSPERPLSPHLQVYRWPVTMLTSITHRFTGIGLGLGFLLLACWLVALSLGEGPYEAVQAFHRSFIGRFLLLGFSWAVIFHLFNGIRHLFWDAGMGFEKETADRTGWVVLALSVVVTLALWWIAYPMGGL
ncbi:MAG: succinate dehydrogenase, cytochrome b556 subunit [Alphaproteobacteria bacterium]|nr:MAG: succinate dehydrogenase, cytochrome b556 subunit [Alphaproteobacteria bacterium]